MTKEEILYCLKADSVGYTESCNKCMYSNKTDVGTCYSEHLLAAIKALERELYDDVISREAVLKLFATHDGNYLYEAIQELPSVQPKKKTGHWVKQTDGYFYFYVCSACGERIPKNDFGNNYFSPFCPECGAMMIESEDKE